MEKRVLLAVFLSFLVLYAYQAIMPSPKRPAPQQAARPTGAAPSSSGTQSQAAALPAPPKTVETGASSAAAPATVAETSVGDASERSITLETRSVIATLTNRGAQITSWRLKHYRDDHGNLV